MTSTQPSAPTLVVLAAGQAKRYGGVKPLAPVGPVGEAVIDMLASDALAAGFGPVVLVIGPVTGPAIRYHVERTWPGAVDVRFALQEVPRGTVDAVLAAAEHLPTDGSFGVANADDLYGEDGLALLAGHLSGNDQTNALVCYRLRNSLIGDAPVTRGVCNVDKDGLLRGVDERRKVRPLADGRIVADDGREPAELDPSSLVSVNLWGFRPEMRRTFEAAMREANGTGEVLLPEVVGDLVAGHRTDGHAATQFRVLEAPGRCIGVTHPSDLTLVQAAVAAEVGRGERPGLLWAGLE
jgi:MobA-like NTP transferase domain